MTNTDHQTVSTGRGRGIRRLALVALLAAFALIASGCDFRLLPIPGDGQVRYRDAIFTDVVKTSDVFYGRAVNVKGDTQDLLMDVYRPGGDPVTAGRPLIILVHGGGFRTGDRAESDIVDRAEAFARKGYVTASIDYRLTSGCSPYTDQCITGITQAKNDAQAAVRLFRAKAPAWGIDPDRIAIDGSSAGAITAINVAYGSDEVGTSGTPGVPSTVRAAVSLSGAAITTSADPGEPPTLFFHSVGDETVPFAWAQSTIDQARATGLQAEVTTWEGKVHVPYYQHKDQILAETANFLWYEMDLLHAPT